MPPSKPITFDDDGYQLKWCNKCKRHKRLDEFGRDRSAKDGRTWYCKRCNADYRRGNAQVIKEKNKAYRIANAEAIQAQRKQAYANNSDIILARNREYCAKNAEAIIAHKRNYNMENKDAKRAADRAWREANPDRKLHNDLVLRYRLPLAIYNALLIAQDGKCAIWGCDTPHTIKRRLSVDHDHACCPGSNSCGRCIRGLICTRCNTALGMAGDSVNRLLGMVQYLLVRERDRETTYEGSL